MTGTGGASAVQANVTECEPLWAPDPSKEIIVGVVAAFLVTVTLPISFPATAGVKVTFNIAFCPGARISPAETPLVVNLASETLTFEMEKSELPALARLTLKTLLLSIVTFPKFRFAKLASRRKVAATPDPLILTVSGESGALLMTEIAPETFPMAFGENTTLNLDCLPAPIVIGSEIPLTENPCAATLACVMDRFELPVFDIATDWETVLPTATCPNLIEVGDIEAAAAVSGVFGFCWAELLVVLFRPVQPEIKSVPSTRRYRGRERTRLPPVFEVFRELAGSQQGTRPKPSVINETYYQKSILASPVLRYRLRTG
jgi:hypothetical protein